jgi:hypothetical protein
MVFFFAIRINSPRSISRGSFGWFYSSYIRTGVDPSSRIFATFRSELATNVSNNRKWSATGQVQLILQIHKVDFFKFDKKLEMNFVEMPWIDSDRNHVIQTSQSLYTELHTVVRVVKHNSGRKEGRKGADKLHIPYKQFMQITHTYILSYTTNNGIPWLADRFFP